MYEYRHLTPRQRETLITERRKRGFPWHSPPHLDLGSGYYIVSAACYEHRKVLHSPERLAWFEGELLQLLKNLSIPCAAWCVLPNHYHTLVELEEARGFSRHLGRLHGCTSHQMNTEDRTRGRKVWQRSQDRKMRSEAHYYTTLNYLHFNPVKHGYVAKCQDWPFSSADWYLLSKGREWVEDLWRTYPIRSYGEKWDRC